MDVSYSFNGSFPNQTNSSNASSSVIDDRYNGHYGPSRIFGNEAIPLWGFNSTSCEWMAALYVDLVLSTLGVTYNAAVFVFLFFVGRLHETQASILGSYAVGCFFCSLYYVYFDISVLAREAVSKPERGMLYVIMLFLTYHLVLHIYLLSWDQYRSVFRCRSHVRYLTKERLVKIGFIIWFGSVVLSLLEAVFLNNVSKFPRTKHVSEFRMVCMLLLLFFFWLLPLVIMTCWNGDLFCFLLKVIHNGYVIQEPEEPSFKPEVMPELAPCPWFNGDNDGAEAAPRNNDGSSFVDENEDEDEEDELPTIPDDVRSELARCFMHVVMTTLFGAPAFVWLTYNLLAIMRTGGRLTVGWEDEFAKSVYNCYTFIVLYFATKVFVILNPLCCYYYRPEIRQMIRRVILRHFVLRLQQATDNVAHLD